MALFGFGTTERPIRGEPPSYPTYFTSATPHPIPTPSSSNYNREGDFFGGGAFCSYKSLARRASGTPSSPQTTAPRSQGPSAAMKTETRHSRASFSVLSFFKITSDHTPHKELTEKQTKKWVGGSGMGGVVGRCGPLQSICVLPACNWRGPKPLMPVF